MRLKKSNPPQKKIHLWRVEPDCSESLLKKVAHEFAVELRARDRVLLEGPMGSGKSTFARELLKSLGIQHDPEGSPTFAIAHEYRGRMCEVIHLDFYRMRSEAELDDAGIPSYFWEREAILLAEWVSLFPDFRSQLLRGASSFESPRKNWEVSLAFHPTSDSSLRHLEIKQLLE